MKQKIRFHKKQKGFSLEKHYKYNTHEAHLFIKGKTKCELYSTKISIIPGEITCKLCGRENEKSLENNNSNLD